MGNTAACPIPEGQHDRAEAGVWCGGSRRSRTSTRGSGSRRRPGVHHLARRRGVHGKELSEQLRLFCGHASDARTDGWPGAWSSSASAPRQILDEWNIVAHVTEFEGQPHRRPLTYDEVQALFDAADGRVQEIRSRGRKGALAAQRDSTLLKTIYAFGLRRREAWG